MSHHVSFVVAERESRNKPAAGSVLDIEETTTGAETEPVTDAEVKSIAETLNIGTNFRISAMGTADV